MTIAGAALMAFSVTAVAAYANAANPLPTTTGSATVNADGSVSVSLNGTWAWPGQDCEGRYGEGVTVDWWGLSSSPLPANNFTLTDATEITDSGQSSPLGTEAHGSIQAAGSILDKATGTYFHVPAYYEGQDVNTASSCTDETIGGVAGSTGPWTASATYPSVSDVPADLCVILYDEHGKEGQPTTKPGTTPLGSDFNPLKDNDNSIDTNAFDPSAGAGYCFSSSFAPHLSVKKTGPTYGTPGGTGTYALTVTNNGNVPVSSATVTDTLPTGETFVSSDPAGACTAGGTPVSGTSPGASATITCTTGAVAANGTAIVSVTVSYAADTAGQTLTDCATLAGQATPSCQPTIIPPVPVTQNLTGHIYLCGGPMTDVTGGTLSATGAQNIASTANPLDASKVAAGDYTMSATAPAGDEFVTCGGNANIGNPDTTATQTVNVPAGGTGNGVFFVSPIPAPVQTLVGHIYLCGSNPADEVSGGTLAATGAQTIASTSNPIVEDNVAAGDYTMSATAPSGYDFTACGGSATIVTPTTATHSVTVPTGGTGTAIFYVTPVVPVTQTLTGNIYLCGSNPGQQITGGTLSATGAQTIASTANPLKDANVAAGDYTVSATAPSGYDFTACSGSATVDTPTTATDKVTVPSGGTGDAVFYVTPIVPVTQTLTGNIYLCGSSPLAQVPGGELSATGPQNVTAAANPLTDSVVAGNYTMSATAPAGYDFVACGGVANVGTPASSATEAVTVPAGGTGDGVFYVSPIPNPVQTLVGHIYLCGSNPGQEITGGTLSATGAQTLPATGNPIDDPNVAAGDYTVSATAPSGYDFTACGGSATIGTPTTATDNVTVPQNGTGTATFFVSPVQPITLTVAKANDANGSGTFAQSETATGPGENVPFKVTITNPSTSPASIKLTDITDQWPGQTPISPSCAGDLVGQVLAPGATAICTFTIDNYSAAAGQSITNTVSVAGCSTTDSSVCTTTTATSTVVTPPATAPGATPPAATPTIPSTPSGGLAFTGTPARTKDLLAGGLGLLSLGLFLLWFTRPNTRPEQA